MLNRGAGNHMDKLPFIARDTNVYEDMLANQIDRYVLDISDIYRAEFHWRLNLFTVYFIKELYMHVLDAFDAGVGAMLFDSIQRYGSNIKNLDMLSEEGRQAVVDMWPRLVFQFYDKFKYHGLFEKTESGSWIPMFPEHVGPNYIVLKLNNRPISQNLGRSHDF